LDPTRRSLGAGCARVRGCGARPHEPRVYVGALGDAVGAAATAGAERL
jgi:hypothetical protein